MNWLNDYDSWQIECLIFSSQLTLNLLSKDDVVTFIHRLMDKGLYDDLMLNIIDDDPIFPSSDFQQTYQQIAQNLQLPFPMVEHARWILILHALFRFLASPYYYGFFQSNDLDSSYNAYELFFDNHRGIFQEVHDFKYLFYRIDEEVDFNERHSMNDLTSITKLQTEFLLMVDGWFTRNSSLLEKIFTEQLDKT